MYLRFAFENKVLHFSLNTAPQVFTCLRHRVAAYLQHQGISVIPYLDDWLIHHPDCQVLLRHQSQLLNILNMVGLRLNEAKSELEPVQDISFWGFHYSWIRGKLPSQYPKLEIWHTHAISSQKTLSYREGSQFMGSLNWASGLIPHGSGYVSVASDSGHNSMSQTHSGLPKCDSRPLVSAEPAHHDRVESPP